MLVKDCRYAIFAYGGAVLAQLRAFLIALEEGSLNRAAARLRMSQSALSRQMQALEAGKSGAAVAWKNPDSGRYGSVVPGPAYESNGLQCRPYTHTIYIDGRPQVARGNACRNPDGTWTAVG